MPQIRIKRIYDPPSDQDGFRVLVDRVWPRGVSRSDAAIDRWSWEIAPSTELRNWFGHDPAKWREFRKRYRAELEIREPGLRALLNECDRPFLTLLYSAKDTEHNQAVVLKEFLEGL